MIDGLPTGTIIDDTGGGFLLVFDDAVARMVDLHTEVASYQYLRMLSSRWTKRCADMHSLMLFAVFTDLQHPIYVTLLEVPTERIWEFSDSEMIAFSEWKCTSDCLCINDAVVF
jgi:hypothetical protein